MMLTMNFLVIGGVFILQLLFENKYCLATDGYLFATIRDPNSLPGSGVFLIANGRHVQLSRNTHATDVGFHKVTQRLYWVDNARQYIISMNASASDIRFEAELDSGGDQNLGWSHYVEGIFVDSSSSLIYYTDITAGAIIAYDINTKRRATLVEETVEAPRDIHVDEQTKHIFWTDWGAYPSVWMAQGDGTGARRLTDSVTWTYPNGLHYDAGDDMLYVCDVLIGTTRTTRLVKLHVPANRVVYTKTLPDVHCFDLTGNDDFIYMSDWRRPRILIINKEDFVVSTLVAFGSGFVSGVHYSKLNFSLANNPCSGISCGSTEVCVPKTGQTYKCMCETERSGRYCLPDPIATHPSFLLALTSRIYGLVGLPRTYIRTTKTRAFYVGGENIVFGEALTIDSHTEVFYAYLPAQQGIVSANLVVYSGSRFSFVKRGVSGVTSMAIDWTVNTLFLTINDGIYVMDPDAGALALITKEDMRNPGSITVDPAKGTLYWCDPDLRRVESMSTDGSNRRILYTNYDVVTIAVDYTDSTIFLATAKRVYRLNGDSSKLLAVYTDSSIKDIDFHNDKVGVLVQNSTGGKNLHFLEPTKFTTNDIHFQFGAEPRALIAHSRDRQPGEVKDCGALNCAEFCVSNTRGQASCLCPINPTPTCPGVRGSRRPGTSTTTPRTTSTTTRTTSTTTKRSEITVNGKQTTIKIQKMSKTTMMPLPKTTPSATGADDDDESSPSKYIVPITVSIVVGGVVIVAAIVAYVCIKRRRSNYIRPPPTFK